MTPHSFCRKCEPNVEPTYGKSSCPHGGGFGTIGTHVYDIHVTAVTYACRCGAWMGRFNSWPPNGQKTVDPWGDCPMNEGSK